MSTRPLTTPLRRLRGTLAVLAMIVAGVFAGVGPAAAAAANGGAVYCMNTEPVVGVWVNVAGGTSGFATRTGSGWSQSWSYNTQGKAYSLNVGYGGSTQSWAVTTRTPSYRTDWQNISYYPGNHYGGGTGYVKDTCFA